MTFTWGMLLPAVLLGGIWSYTASMFLRPSPTVAKRYIEGIFLALSFDLLAYVLINIAVGASA